MNNRKRKLKIGFVILLGGIGLLIGKFIAFGDKVNDKEVITYNEVVKELKEGTIDKIRVKDKSKSIIVVMKDGTEKKSKVPDSLKFIEFISHKIEEGSDVEIQVNSTLNVSSLLSIILLAGYASMLVIMRNQTSGGKFSIGTTKTKVTFDDVAGIEEVQEQIEDIIEYLKNPKKYKSIGAKMPKGILLSGESGNGKTLLAKAMSGEAGVEFFQVTGSSFEERLVGVGASRVRKLFKEAKQKAPAIIFIDEIDSVAKSRYSTNNSNNEQTLNQLLAEMDGFESSDNIVVIAATNHIEVLDDAILRPGRFDRRIYIPNPDVRARRLILELHAKDKKISSEVSFEAIAQKTVGFSGADLKNVLNEAAIYSVKMGREKIDNEAVEEAIARIIVGLKKKYSVMSQEEKYLLAIHESGHAVVSAVIRPEIQNFCISIVPRGKTGGYNFFDESVKCYQGRIDLLKQMQVLFGGRIAEEIIFKDLSTGASNDLEKASQIALQMVTKYGMNGSLLVEVKNENEYNKEIEKRAVEAAEQICQKVYNEAKNIVIKHQLQIKKLADILVEKEYLTREEVAKFMSENFNL